MFERTQVGADGLRVDTVIDFQDEEKEKFFTDLYEWIESVVLPDVEVTHSFVWGERKSFAFYTGDFYELPNNDGWERSDSTLSSIRLSRICKHHEISIEIMLFPLFAKAMRSGMDAVKKELLDEPIIQCLVSPEELNSHYKKDSQNCE
jgi:hypothetical protein